jgi:hypothetical protein
MPKSRKTQNERRDFPMKLFKSRPSLPDAVITDEVRQVLHRVGLTLFVLGLIDIMVMICCIVNGVNYSSSLNIFAVISGIYVWRGHPWYVKWVTLAAGFYIGAFCTVILIALFLFPFELGMLELSLHPVRVLVGAAESVGIIVLLFWIYRELRRAPVLETYKSADYSPRSARVVPSYGAMLAFGIGAILIAMMRGDEAQRAIALATAKTGPGYRYFITHISYTNNGGSAEVLAYDDRSIKEVQVKW